jgi:hypothetical protein
MCRRIPVFEMEDEDREIDGGCGHGEREVGIESPPDEDTLPSPISVEDSLPPSVSKRGSSGGSARGGLIEVDMLIPIGVALKLF